MIFLLLVRSNGSYCYLFIKFKAPYNWLVKPFEASVTVIDHVRLAYRIRAAETIWTAIDFSNTRPSDEILVSRTIVCEYILLLEAFDVGYDGALYVDDMQYQ